MSVTTTQTRRLHHVLDTLWYTISAPQVTAALFVLLALMLGLAAVFPQLPPGLEKAEIDRWLTTAAGRFPGTGMFLASIGAFDLLHSAWARAILAVLALNLTLRAAAYVRFLRDLRHPSADTLPPPHVTTRRATLPGPLEHTVTRLRTALEPHYTVVVQAEAAGDTARSQIFAQRRPAGALGPLFAHLGLLLLLAGLAVNGTIGWRVANIALAPGNTTTLNRSGALQISLNDVATLVSATPVSTGNDETTRTNLTLTQAGRSRIVHPSPARPARWGNLWLSQQATGPALTVTGLEGGRRATVLQSLDSNGEVGPTLRILFRQTQSEQGFAIPTRNLTFRAVSYAALPEQGIEGPVFLVEAYRGEDTAPVATEFVADEGSLVLDDITLTLRRDRYVELEAAYLPGLIPLLLGSLLILLGTTITAYRGIGDASIARVWANFALSGEQVLAIIAVAGPAAPQAEIERLLRVARAPEATDAV